MKSDENNQTFQVLPVFLLTVVSRAYQFCWRSGTPLIGLETAHLRLIVGVLAGLTATSSGLRLQLYPVNIKRKV
jgi:hypothetical protein